MRSEKLNLTNVRAKQRKKNLQHSKNWPIPVAVGSKA